MQGKPVYDRGGDGDGWGRGATEADIHGGCALILYVFAAEHIPIYGTNLISVVSPKMLKFDAIIQYKSFSTMQTVFSRTASK